MGMQAAPVSSLLARAAPPDDGGVAGARYAVIPAAHSAALFADADDEEQEDAMSMAGDGVCQGLPHGRRLPDRRGRRGGAEAGSALAVLGTAGPRDQHGPLGEIAASVGGRVP